VDRWESFGQFGQARTVLCHHQLVQDLHRRSARPLPHKVRLHQGLCAKGVSPRVKMEISKPLEAKDNRTCGMAKS